MLKAEMLEVVGGVDRDRELGRRQRIRQPQRQLGAADTAGERENFSGHGAELSAKARGVCGKALAWRGALRAACVEATARCVPREAISGPPTPCRASRAAPSAGPLCASACTSRGQPSADAMSRAHRPLRAPPPVRVMSPIAGTAVEQRVVTVGEREGDAFQHRLDECRRRRCCA